MVKYSDIIRRILTKACIYYTIASLLLYTGGRMVSGIEREWIPTLSMMYMVLGFSVLFSTVNEIVYATTWPGVIKLLIHYSATTLIFYVMFILWGNYDATPSAALIILLAYTLLYAAIALVVHFLTSLGTAKKRRASAYKSQFSDTRHGK